MVNGRAGGAQQWRCVAAMVEPLAGKKKLGRLSMHTHPPFQARESVKEEARGGERAGVQGCGSEAWTQGAEAEPSCGLPLLCARIVGLRAPLPPLPSATPALEESPGCTRLGIGVCCCREVTLSPTPTFKEAVAARRGSREQRWSPAMACPFPVQRSGQGPRAPSSLPGAMLTPTAPQPGPAEAQFSGNRAPGGPGGNHHSAGGSGTGMDDSPCPYLTLDLSPTPA